jgi:hypothetical protein
MNVTCGSVLCAIISIYEITCCGLFAYSLKDNCKKMTYEKVNQEEDEMEEADRMLNMGMQKEEETTIEYRKFNIKSSLETLYE